MKTKTLLSTLVIIVVVWVCVSLSVWGLTVLGMDVGGAVAAVFLPLGVVAFIFAAMWFIDG